MKAVTAMKLLHDLQGRKSRLSFGCPVLDQVSGGGIPLGGVTEIVGEAGAGKTQTALSLTLQCCLPIQLGGLGGVAAYISCGEGEFPIRRLCQIATVIESTKGISSNELVSAARILKCHNIDHLMDTLKKEVPQLCQQKLRAVVIDSIAGLMRTEFDSSSNKDMTQRTESMFTIARELKWLAHTFDLAVVVINQVTAAEIDSYSEAELDSSRCLHGKESVNPALGLAWSHCVNTRIKLIRDARDVLAIRSLSGNGSDLYGADDDDEYYDLSGESIATTANNTYCENANEWNSGAAEDTIPGIDARGGDGDQDGNVTSNNSAAKRRRLEAIAAAAEDEDALWDAVDEYCASRSSISRAALREEGGEGGVAGKENNNNYSNRDAASSAATGYWNDPLPLPSGGREADTDAFHGRLSTTSNATATDGGLNSNADNDASSTGGSAFTKSKRVFVLDMSPCNPSRACSFEVTAGGVVGLEIL